MVRRLVASGKALARARMVVLGMDSSGCHGVDTMTNTHMFGIVVKLREEPMQSTLTHVNAELSN